jgi:ribulose kinase
VEGAKQKVTQRAKFQRDYNQGIHIQNIIACDSYKQFQILMVIGTDCTGSWIINPTTIRSQP